MGQNYRKFFEPVTGHRGISECPKKKVTNQRRMAQRKSQIFRGMARSASDAEVFSRNGPKSSLNRTFASPYSSAYRRRRFEWRFYWH
jgi:hypothetical protein